MMNGQESQESQDHRGWVRFGDRGNQILHPDTAETVLRCLFERHRAMFSALLGEALTGEPPKGRRSR